MSVIAVENVWKFYGDYAALRDITLDVENGCCLALLGRNGAGKTTTLNVISGQLAPTHGSVMLAGRRVNGASADQIARLGVCTVPEGRGVFPNLTVHENLRLFTYRGVSIDEVEVETFARFPRLQPRRKQLAGTLSGGEQQMLALARALTTRPAVLLLDELSMGLAPIVVEELYQQVAKIATEGISVLVVEQFARTVLAVADFAAVMHNGCVHQAGTPDAVMEQLSDTYLGGNLS
jgi:branched-chain amino acid transport system ATP-binding protein